MKITLNRILITTIIATLLGGTVIYGNKALAFASNVSKAQMYEKHLQPKIGAYYSVQGINKEGGNIFVVGKIVRPEIGGKVSEVGQLTTIVVTPAKGTGLMKGPYLTVTTEKGALITKFFIDERSVVQHALDN